MNSLHLTQAYQTAHESSAFFDRSTVGKLSLKGPDTLQFLHRLCTNDIKNLAIGTGCETYLCDHRARALQQFWVYRLHDGLWLETVPDRSAALYSALDRFLISEQVEMTDVTSDYAQIHCSGKHSPDVIAKLTGLSSSLKEFEHREVALPNGEKVMVVCRAYVSKVGFDLTFKADQFDYVQDVLKPISTLGNELDFETLRIEHGMPEYGKDIDENRFMMEIARASRAVNYSKGCFPGQEPIVMVRDRAGGLVNRSFMIMKAEGTVPFSSGSPLTQKDAEVGVVTSSIVSPRFGGVVVLGYVKRGLQDIGTKFDLEGRHVEIVAKAE
jgi:tRNA-modifying protein YgfZ